MGYYSDCNSDIMVKDKKLNALLEKPQVKKLLVL